MLRPERMSKVSVTAADRVVEDVIEAAYEQHALHVSEYDDSWEGFRPGQSLEGADETAEKLVTVRSLESILDLGPDDATPRRDLAPDELERELESVRERVNELDDRRNELRSRLREVREEIDRAEPFADLGVDLDLLGGYRTLDVLVGEGKADAVDAALAEAGTVDTYELFTGGSTVAVVARPAEGAGGSPIGDALVGVDFTALAVPDAEGSPEAYLRELESERAELESKLETVESELEDVKAETGGFLLAAEEQLTIESQKQQAPLSFATTANAFVAEGWIPTDRYGAFEAALRDAVGDHVEVEELERAEYDATGDHHAEAVGEEPSPPEPDREPAVGPAGEGDDEGEPEEEEPARAPAADGGYPTIADGDPPVVQDNGRLATPFETLVRAVNRPKYSELDPTLLVFLTFPLMFGFMISDMGYGLLYLAIGYFLWTRYDSDGMVNVGAVAMWAGGFTFLFGIGFGFDLFGYHLYPLLGFESWGPSKGISPGAADWARAWLVLSVLFGLLHLNVGWGVSFANLYGHHGPKHAVYEAGSWLLLLNGLWVWLYSTHGAASKPDMLWEAFNTILGAGFTGFPIPEAVGLVGLAAIGVGAVLLAVGEPAELPEIFQPLVHTVSYARIMAVLLAKGGMAVVANLLAFGAYVDHGSFEFIFTAGHLAELEAEGADVMFAGLTTQGPVGIVAGLVVAVVGHVLVLLLGITAAGIQGIRLEYVEFFGKFYEGGGREYRPFGYERRYTAGE